jgi:PIN domain nuclease of toxin-antitoxin system
VILLDTHVVLWMSTESRRLSKIAREAIVHARSTTGVAVATFTLWELAWIAENRRIKISGSVESFVRDAVSRVTVKAMTPEIASLAVRLPASYLKDPGDRVIAATAIMEGMPLVTADQRIRDSAVVQTIW